MKSVLILLLAMFVSASVNEAEDSQPQPAVPDPTSGGVEEPALPTPEAGPTEAAPSLLPESGELPAHAPSERSTVPASLSVTAKPSAEERQRFDKIRSEAMSSPHALYLLKRARRSSTVAARRTYLRAYYTTVAERMRKLEPGLRSSIDAYQEARVHEVAEGTGSSRRVSQPTSSHRAATRKMHRTPRRMSSHHHRYQRMIIYDDYYPPDMPPYGPPFIIYAPW